jgi:integrase/recombinase XerD
MTGRDLCLVEPRLRGDEATHGLVDRYVEFVAARCRPNTVAATRSDLGVFFSVVDRPPVEVTPSDVLEFIAAQRRPRDDGTIVRLADGEAGLSARTIKRRVATVSGFYGWLMIIGAVASNPVPRGLSTRRRGRRSGVPLVRTPRTLPKVLDPDEVNALLGALRRWRDRAMVEAMVLGGLRRCEVLGLCLEDLRPAERRVFVAEGKGGHQRLVPISARFFVDVARYLDTERDHRPGVRGAQRPPTGPPAVRGRAR